MIMFLICLSYIAIVGGVIGYIAEDVISDRFGEPATSIIVLVWACFAALPLLYMFN